MTDLHPNIVALLEVADEAMENAHLNRLEHAFAAEFEELKSLLPQLRARADSIVAIRRKGRLGAAANGRLRLLEDELQQLIDTLEGNGA